MKEIGNKPSVLFLTEECAQDKSRERESFYLYSHFCSLVKVLGLNQLIIYLLSWDTKGCDHLGLQALLFSRGNK